MCIIISILLDHTQIIKDLKYELFVTKMDSARRFTSVYRYVREYGDVQLWQIEKDIVPLSRTGLLVFNENRDAPIQGQM